jgi:hypothetical protein
MALQLQRPTRPMRTEPRMPHGGNALSRHDGVRGASVSSRSAAHAPPRRAPLLSIPVQAQSARRPHLISRRYHIQYISNIRMHPASTRPISSMGIGEPGTTPLSKCGQGFAGKRSIPTNPGVRSASKRFRQDRGRRPEGYGRFAEILSVLLRPPGSTNCLNLWRATQNKTSNSYVIEIAI